MPNINETIGRLANAVENTEKQLMIFAGKMDAVLNFQAKTEERLNAGNKKFEDLKLVDEKQEQKIKEVQNSMGVIELKTDSFPKSGKVYALIVGGFTLLAFLVSIIAIKQ